MKKIIDKILWKIGLYGPIPIPPVRQDIDGPFVHLHDMARNQATSALLDGFEFEIPDGFSFYWMHKEICRDQAYLFRVQQAAPYIIDCGSNCGVSFFGLKTIAQAPELQGSKQIQNFLIFYLVTWPDATLLMSSCSIEPFRPSPAMFPSTA
jgi:hypothetical protein